MKLDPGKFISFAILLITISSINQWSKYNIGNTFFWWAVFACVLIALFNGIKIYHDSYNDRAILPVKLYLFWNISCIIRGIFVPENYWEWKDLVGTGLVLLLPVTVYIATNANLVQRIVAYWFKYALPAFFIFFPFFIYSDAVGRYLVPVYFVLLFFWKIPTKWKLICLFFTALVVLGAPDARSNVMKYSFSFLASFFVLLPLGLASWLMKVGQVVLLTVPIILFGLGATGVFNVFKMDEYVGEGYNTTVTQNGQTEEQNLTVDTRTFLYDETISSAIKYNYVLFGRTPARGYESPYFGDFALEVLKTGKMERHESEVSLLNIFTWTGLIGVLLYFYIFLRASYLAIYQSNNVIMRIVGLSVAFRWTIAWIEDFSEFDLSYFFLWILIGMCLSKAFREMDDDQIKNWALGIFNKQYRQMDEDDDESSEDMVPDAYRQTA